ncbi:MAG: pyruvate kinase [Porticoccus sp.]|jgi:pyruvate kinase|uniref:pyruvate kinase n=1 Tax=Porticoccus hydrocarbonoclasticus TaxID=1073414 RepID=UPI000561E7D7|nr:pyruvate kinase [Porticoccus hydrocarbonoclasticus]MBG58560.1 pyruvate kinase [Porticoccus sp.]|tara:strand:- start:77 stop:1501 length:1425 start_codon:yes stop_codon:yes gene_type:complete
MRKTKIICTIGPVTESYDMLEQLADAGMNVVRLNMSHGDHESHARVIKAVRTLNKKRHHPIAVLIDTQGPEIRTGDIHNELDLKQGDEISVVARGEDDVEASSIRINYENLIDDVEIGDKITVDNGLINLEVLSKEDRVMRCRVVDGGVLKSKRHVNLPGIRVNLPAITEKDKRDIEFAIEQEVDFIALSFVRDAEDIHQLHQLLGDKADKIKVISKIEDQEGVKNVREIIKVSDGLMVARGDLGVEIAIEKLPRVQRRIIRLCAQEGKRVIVATHMLESMIENPMPTRAEVTDVANAVYEEADAIMLSGETTIGKYPVKCVEILDRIARSIELSRGLRFTDNLILKNDKEEIAAAAVKLAESIKAKAIIVPTRRGRMAGYVTNCHPQAPIICAFTNDSRTRRQLVLNRNVLSFRINFSEDPEKTLATAANILIERAEFTPEDRLVVISDALAGSGIDAIQIRKLGDLLKVPIE